MAATADGKLSSTAGFFGIRIGHGSFAAFRAPIGLQVGDFGSSETPLRLKV